MPIFKIYFKILKSNKMGFLLSYIIFFAMSISILFSTNSNSNEGKYNIKNYKIAIVNRTKNDYNEIVSFIKEKFTLKEINDKKDDFIDELFNKKVDYILIIEDNGFYENTGQEIEKGIIIRNYLQEFISLSDVHSSYEIKDNKIVASILNKNIETDYLKIVKENEIGETFEIYYNFISYSLVYNIIYLFGIISFELRKKGVRERIEVSGIKQKKLNNRIIVAHSLVILFFILSFVALGIFIFGLDYAISSKGLLMLLNIFVFSLSVLGIATLITKISTDIRIIRAISNLLSLCLSAISGVFMPIYMLPKALLTVSKLFPVYWYVNGNHTITNYDTFSHTVRDDYFKGLTILLLMALASYVLGIAISKNKRRESVL